MYQQQKILAIIPARGGSKGLPRKNILPFLGRPLIHWTIEAAKKSRYLDRIILSSEDSEIIDVARQAGCEIPFIRPDVLAQDDTLGIDVILHALETLHESYDYFVVLQPTSPLRTALDIDLAIQQTFLNAADFCVSVTIPDKHPYWSFMKDEHGFLKPVSTEIITRRQSLPEMFALNGAVYVAKTQAFLAQKTFLTTHTQAYVMPKERSFDIDTALDFYLCECVANRELTLGI